MSSIAQETLDVSHLDIRMKKCPVCGKEFYVPDSEKWGYQRGKHLYFHTWSCLRKYDENPDMYKEERSQPMNNRMEIARKMGEVIDQGGNPLKYLEGLGYRNPHQALRDLRNLAKAKDPELYERIKSKKQPKQKEPETKAEPVINAGPGDGDEGEDWQKWVPEPEPEKKLEARQVDGFRVSGLDGKFGRYSVTETASGQWLDVDMPGSDTISMKIEEWREFGKEVAKVAKIMGVEL